MTLPVELPDGFKETPLGLLPNEWDVSPLASVLIDENNRAGDFLEEKALEFPVLSLTKNDGLILQSERFKHRVATEDVSKYKIVKRGQIVYNPYVIWEGAVHALRKYDRGLVSPAYPVLSANPEKANPYFLDDLLRTPLAIAAYNRFAAGAVNRRRAISQRDFGQILIPVPPLREQHAIAAALTAVRRAIESTEAVIAAARETKRAMMHHLFTYGPVPIAEAGAVAVKETKIGDMPEDWEVVRLDTVIEAAEYGLNNRAETVGTYPVLRMNNLVCGLVDTTDLKFVELSPTDLKKYSLEKGDVLFNRTNSFELVGKTSIFIQDGVFVFASYLVRVRTQEERLSPVFLNYYLNWEISQQRLRGMATRGVSQSNISAGKLRTFEIALPNLDEQKKIVAMLESIDAKIQTEVQHKAALETMFSSLLQNLMTGKIRLDPEG